MKNLNGYSCAIEWPCEYYMASAPSYMNSHIKGNFEVEWLHSSLKMYRRGVYIDIESDFGLLAEHLLGPP